MDGLIQILVLICLFIIIALLAIDKVQIVKREKTQKYQQVPSKATDVMGKVLTLQKNVSNVSPQDGESAYNGEEHFPNTDVPPVLPEIPQEENRSNADFDDELPYDDERFAQGVSLNELMKVGSMLQQESLNESQEKETVEVMQKIQGTEFFDMLQSSIAGASEKIAMLLDKSLAANNEIEMVEKPKSDIDSFDIGNFI